MIVHTNDTIKDVLKRQRIFLSLSFDELAEKSGISSSHLRRIERGERYPSAHVLKKLAREIGIEESELFTLAGFLSHDVEYNDPVHDKKIDPIVAGIIAQEPIEIQRLVIGILTLLKNLA